MHGWMEGRNGSLLCLLMAVSLNISTGNLGHKPASNLQHAEGNNRTQECGKPQEVRPDAKELESAQHHNFIKAPLSIPLLEVHGHFRVRSL